MPQPPSPHSPSPNDPTPPRRLIPPQERFAEPQIGGESEVLSEDDNPFEAQVSARWRDEMARRHLPPRERARQERARLRRESLARENSARRRTVSSAVPSEQRGRAERDFVQTARHVAPLAPTPRPRRRMPLWLKRLFALVALIFVGQLGFAMFTAPQFNIGAVEIRGIVATPENELQPLALRLVGQNLLRMKAGEVERAVQFLPTVQQAHVVRLAQWPPKVALQITERQPFLKVGAGQDWWVVDEQGVPFRRPGPEDEALYSVFAPRFSPEVRKPLDPQIWARARALETAIEADNRLADVAKNEESGRFWQLRRIYFDRDGLASLRLSRAPHQEMLVRLGDESWPAKLARARASLAYFERTGRRAAELDLVSLERPVWTQRIVKAEKKTAPDEG